MVCVKIDRIAICIAFLVLLPSSSLAQDADPAREFLDGNYTTFSTQGHPKAKGVHFTIAYPNSWAAEEGIRPNIIQKFTSEGGRGLDSAMIWAGALPFPAGTTFTDAELKEFFTSTELRDIVPEGAKFINAKQTRIEGLPAGILEYSLRGERAGMVIDTQVIFYIFIHRSTMVQLQCAVSGVADAQENISRRMAALKPLFTLMANSIVIPDKWTPAPESSTSKQVAALPMDKEGSLAAKEFHSSAFGYSLDVPPGWEEIPRNLIQETYADLLKPDSVGLYDAGFQLASSDGWFAYPFVLVQVMPLPRQINEDEFESFVQALTGMDFNKEIPTDTLRNLDNLEFGQVQLDADRRRYFSILNMDVKGVGPIRALSVGHFGRDSMVMIHSYSLRSDFDRDAEARLAIVDSFRFDPDKAYSV